MIYEQAKWQLLAEEIDCTEEEMLMFAALQVFYYYICFPSQPNLISLFKFVHPDSSIVPFCPQKSARDFTFATSAHRAGTRY